MKNDEKMEQQQQQKKIHPTINNNNPCVERTEKNIFNDNVRNKMMHFELSNCNAFGL